MKYFLILFYSINALAADGYKEFKWSMNKTEVEKKAKNCSLKRVPQQDESIEAYECSNFLFGGDRIPAFFMFVGNKLSRIVLNPPVSKAGAIVQGLKDKYGVSSSSSNSKDFELVDTTPGAVAKLFFDKDTIAVIASNEGAGKQSIIVVYESPDFDTRLKNAQIPSLKNDL